jgi:hypothetical protein
VIGLGEQPVDRLALAASIGVVVLVVPFVLQLVDLARDLRARARIVAESSTPYNSAAARSIAQPGFRWLPIQTRAASCRFAGDCRVAGG